MSTIHHIFMLNMEITNITIEINSGIIEGKFPKRALSLVLEWYGIHKDELLQDWESIRTTGEFNKIALLE